MLHILNGDATVSVLKQTNIPGELLTWRETLITGPTPKGLSHDDWLTTRANHLAEAYEQNFQESRNNLVEQECILHTFAQHEEVVLWFENDLFCQTNLIYLLKWFTKQNLVNTKLFLICIDKFPGVKNFRGLGQLNPEQLIELYKSREEITTNILELAAEAWNAYCSPNPTKIEDFIETDTSAMPFLRNALLAHLARFPSVGNGLGHIENQILNLVAGGIDEFTPLFHVFCEIDSDYGLGDWQFWLHLKNLYACNRPVLNIEGTDENEPTISTGTHLNSSFIISNNGKAVLDGELDFIEMNGIDSWLGGVHLCNARAQWLWDVQKQKIIKYGTY